MEKFPMIKETGFDLEKYRMIEEYGCGHYGVVWKAFNKYTGEIVAIKKLDDLLKKWISLRECKYSLEKIMISNLPDISDLKEVVHENNSMYLIFEYMECSLRECMLDLTKPVSEAEIRDLCFQLFQGLDDMHSKNYVHGDIKPSNLLVYGDLIKIGNAGHAREMNIGEPSYTGYVTSLWYRAPEMLLCSPMCNYAVDMWGMGAIMVELFTNQPLFQGSSSANVLDRICKVLGSPTERTWLVGLYLANKRTYQFPEHFGWHISKLVPYASSEAINLIDSLLSWDPDMRPTAMEALQHPFFDSCYIDLPLDSERVEASKEDIIRMLPEYLYDYEMEKETSVKSCTVESEKPDD